ncbi:LysR family transcriptional regulator [Idiomarina tyrosinivorans]|uniref:LysR family transcriptional regulator n=1 Tax=Idiomarina tyrosinivorans TaxID=1445662 RepID=A0A432ZSA8_9GAMM|nr:LysR family transcriptional regulator [Idiomarina tyrosinivorans]RUO80805.1 LysR family transcriptional regulator [Idiomarina tyrosinivorans]
MKQLSMDALRAFVSVVDLQSFTAAGQQLGRSQPAISLQLQRLDEQLGVKLLHRQGGRIQLTGPGSHLYQYAQQMLALNDQAFAHFQQAGLSGQARLGIPSEFANSVLPKLLGQFAGVHPQISLEVTSALSRSLLADLEKYYDVIIALRERHDNRQDELLRQDPLIWVGEPPSDSQASIPLVVAPEGCIYRHRATTALKQQGRKFHITYTNADFTGLSAAIRSGLGMTVLAASTVPADLYARQQPNLPSLGMVSVVMRKSPKADPVADHLANFLRERI